MRANQQSPHSTHLTYPISHVHLVKYGNQNMLIICNTSTYEMPLQLLIWIYIVRATIHFQKLNHMMDALLRIDIMQYEIHHLKV